MKKTLRLAVAALSLSATIAPLSTVKVSAFESTIFSASVGSWRSRSIEEVQSSVNEVVASGNQIYTIQWGDTLGTISAATGISVNDLASINQIANPDLIIAGSVLYFDAVNHTLTYTEPNGEEVTVAAEETLVEDTIVEDGYLIEEIAEWELEDSSEYVAEEEAARLAAEEAARLAAEEEAARLAAEEEAANLAVEEEAARLAAEEEAARLATEEEAANLAAEEEAANLAVEEEAARLAAEEEAANLAAEEEAARLAAEEEAARLAAEEEAARLAAEEEAANLAAEEEAARLAAEEEAARLAAEEEAANSTDPTVYGTAITVEATAYSRNEAGLGNFTADGTDLRNESNVIAVDPSVIPLGTTVYIPGWGYYRAADTGGAIVGNKIDVHFENVADTYQFGRQSITIYIVD
ncbi:LysM peptidoglycan-binding domain-containing protein [Aerococcaceae bacterium WS4759]|uniref:LysM peptidoglycan-binding domain-containing protein n=1 Tax=Fundicoccus ignavus TaxID=2664442 RepID=A0A6I2GIP5_9LACT|nr:3D domain-containing protein [Fundicoccus ignavus]MRI85722.1 LysM peptidoglycan-binding domain-containing protein [Fundicoccus ignavus]